jgi:hypothetical protein
MILPVQGLVAPEARAPGSSTPVAQQELAQAMTGRAADMANAYTVKRSTRRARCGATQCYLSQYRLTVKVRIGLQGCAA